MAASAFEIVQAFLLSIGGAAFIILGLSSWLGKVWAARILEKDRLRYTKEMESIKQSNKTISDALNVASSAHSETLKIYAELRSKAISQLWNDFLKIKNATPLSLFFLDLIPHGKTVSQILTVKGKAGINGQFSDSKRLFMELSSECFSPYLDERHLELLYLYRKAVFRIHYYYEKIESNDSVNDGSWRFDELLLAQFKLTFGEDTSLKMQNDKWTISYFLTFIEKHLITELRHALNGEKDSNSILEKALKNISEVSEIRMLELKSDEPSQ